ncbi:MAG: hypothetical protein DI536_10050 [Archangium gephyra]|uniref:Uncharacterized protein n=1 Tax=Archangium gephyra TaxID=48 RepID=A0A2W5VE86_9BACT|nr:MAG: hypothetical protein DI536_10050 [Archangium gephyra]
MTWLAMVLVSCGVQYEQPPEAQEIGVQRQAAGFNENTCICYDVNKQITEEFIFLYCSSTPIGQCPRDCPPGTRYASIISTRCVAPYTTVYDWFCGDWPDFVPCSGI